MWPSETLKIWLLHTGCVLGKDRGVLGRGNSRMEFRDIFVFGYSSPRKNHYCSVLKGVL